MKKLIIDLKDTPFKKIYVNKYIDLSDEGMMELKARFDDFINELSNARNLTGLDIYIATPQRSKEDRYDKVYFNKEEGRTYLKFANYFYQENEKSLLTANIEPEENEFVSFIKNKSTNNIFRVSNRYFKDHNKSQFSISIGKRSLDIDLVENEYNGQLIKIENSTDTIPEYKLCNAIVNKDNNSIIHSVRKEFRNGVDFYFVKLQKLFVNELVLVNNTIMGTSLDPNTYALIRKYSTVDDLTTITQKYKMDKPITENHDALYSEMNCFWDFEELIEDNNLYNKNIHFDKLISHVNEFINDNDFYQLSENNYNLLNNIINETTSKSTIKNIEISALSKFKELDSSNLDNTEFKSLDLDNIGELWSQLNFDLKISENKQIAKVKAQVSDTNKRNSKKNN